MNSRRSQSMHRSPEMKVKHDFYKFILLFINIITLDNHEAPKTDDCMTGGDYVFLFSWL